MENGRNCLRNTPERFSGAGPPCQQGRPSLSPALTDAQRQFAVEHHALIYDFLVKRKLDVLEYYDIAAMGYLRAVQRYLTQPALSRYRFSTVAWRSMAGSLGAFFHSERRHREGQSRYAQAQSPQADGLWERLEADLLLHDLARIATEEQYALVRLRLKGFSMREAARVRGIGVKRVRRLLKDLYRAYLNTV